ncbi:MAG TPA: transglycosylase SLT domain-containing protein [Candidatus Limiplasma sp.]|nr:transglycosylase SLT domain-containing protein [Candidatus Limiplasma sp.]HPS80233.1 transglycosylase SLT domain-containing protein [Candidatus Limiplasma sp.]
MLLCLPRKYRSEDEDYAPRDYSFVGSVAEGARRQQAEPIHKPAESATVRHRADPTQRETVDSNVQNQTASGEPRGYEAARRLPREADGPAPAASIAYPRPRDNGFTKAPTYAPQSPAPLQAAQAQWEDASRQASTRDGGRDAYIPEDAREGSDSRGAECAPRQASASARAFSNGAEPPSQSDGRESMRRGFDRNAALQATAQAEQQQSGDPRAEVRTSVRPGDLFAPDGSQFAAPAPQEIPDWLRVAQQNNLPFDEERRRRATKVEAAPKQEAEPLPTDLLGRPIGRRPMPAAQVAPNRISDYEAAGYPPELIDQQRFTEQTIAEDLGFGRKRHGAQVAVPPPQGGRAEVHRGAEGQSDRRTSSSLPTREEYARLHAEATGASAEYRRGYAPRADFAPGGGLAQDPYGTPEADRYNPYYAQNVRRQRSEPDPDWPEDGPEEQEEKPKLVIPYLGIAVFVAALVVVGLWIMQLTFANEKADVLANRAAAIEKLANSHPYQYRDLIEREATANNLHPAFVAAIVLNESSFNPKAESDVGARGLMQMMPDTAEWVHGKMGLTDEYSFDQMYDPDTNVHYACWYLAFLSDRFHNDPILVSAAFHAGQNTVQNWLNDSRYSQDAQTISLSQMADGPTKTYATRVLKAFATYRRLYYEGGLDTNTTAGAAASGAT